VQNIAQKQLLVRKMIAFTVCLFGCENNI